MGEELRVGTGAPTRAMAGNGVVLRSRAGKEKKGAPMPSKSSSNGSEVTQPDLALVRCDYMTANM